jgi:hypothetical protein
MIDLKKSEQKTIDMTPTWEGALTILRAIIEAKTPAKTKQDAWDELHRMAQLADLYIKSFGAAAAF